MGERPRKKQSPRKGPCFAPIPGEGGVEKSNIFSSIPRHHWKLMLNSYMPSSRPPDRNVPTFLTFSKQSHIISKLPRFGPKHHQYARVSFFCPWASRCLYTSDKPNYRIVSTSVREVRSSPHNRVCFWYRSKYGKYTNSDGPLSWSAVRLLLALMARMCVTSSHSERYRCYPKLAKWNDRSPFPLLDRVQRSRNEVYT